MGRCHLLGASWLGVLLHATACSPGSCPLRLGACQTAAALPDPTLDRGRSPAPPRRRCSRERCSLGMEADLRGSAGVKAVRTGYARRLSGQQPLRRRSARHQRAMRGHPHHLTTPPHVSYGELLKGVLRVAHDPRAESPGPDVGEQYRLGDLYGRSHAAEGGARSTSSSSTGRQLREAIAHRGGEQRTASPSEA